MIARLKAHITLYLIYRFIKQELARLQMLLFSQSGLNSEYRKCLSVPLDIPKGQMRLFVMHDQK